MARVRVLPAVIAVSLGALAFKGADIAYAFAEAADPAAAPETPADPAHAEEAPPPAGAAAPAAGAAQCAPATDYASETGISEQEILVLRSLADRRAQLEEREAAAATQEQLNAASAKKLEEQIVQLKAVEGNVQKLLAAMDVKRDERMATLVKTYEGMKPADAARIFNAMDDTVLVDISKAMKPAVLAGIMSKMEVRRAEQLTRMLAALSAAPPASASVPGAAPAPAAAAPARPTPAPARPTPAAATPASTPPKPTPAATTAPSPAPATPTPG